MAERDTPDRHFRRLLAKAGVVKLLLWTLVAYWAYEAFSSAAFLTSGSFPTWYPLPVLATYVLVFLGTGVAFLVWSHAAHRSLRFLGRQRPKYQDSATIWWWIVPLATWFVPYKVLGETARGSVASPDHAGDTWRSAPLPAVVGWWTALFLGAQFLSGSGGALLQTSSVDVDIAIAVSLVEELLWLAAAIACIRMIALLTRRQFSLHSEGHSVAPIGVSEAHDAG